MSAYASVEIQELLEALCEDRLTADQHARLEELVLNSADARAYYLNYIDLHGMLAWDVAAGAGVLPTIAEPALDVPSQATSRRATTRRLAAVLTAAATLVIAALLGWDWLSPSPADSDALVDTNPEDVAPGAPEFDPEPVVLPDTHHGQGPGPVEVVAGGPTTDDRQRAAIDPAQMVAFIDEQLAAGWSDAGIEPSQRADDAEWLRRVYLDVVGHTPPPEMTESFLASAEPAKRSQLLDQLLSDREHADYLAGVWVNLLVGRSVPRGVDRGSLREYLANQFAENRPWTETVSELIAAEGTTENGPTNFLLAHLNNQAVPATAVTARCFLGTQVQCTQCHKHPFNDIEQDQFWSLNSFFQQSDIVQHTRMNPQTGGREFSHLELVSKNTGGATHYETRSGEAKVAFPVFAGQEIDSGPETNRRKALAGLLAADHDGQLARAFVNRTWAHFFGQGFTTPIDDMGPHARVSHPELLDELAAGFAATGYDVNQLIRWIGSSRAYHLTSRVGASNEFDDPAFGEAPLFSRMYVKPLTAEQLFDSVLVATAADRTSEWNIDRDEWLSRFFEADGTEENCEVTTFDGSLPQALSMMNGELVVMATSGEPDTYLGRVLAERADEETKIRKLCLAVLSRYPSDQELEAIQTQVRRVVRQRTSRSQNAQVAVNEVLRDVFWAYLNSSEFSVNH